MKKTLVFLNVVLTFFRTLICALGIVGFILASFHFGKWWILLFTIIPLFAYNETIVVNHTVAESEVNREEDE